MVKYILALLLTVSFLSSYSQHSVMNFNDEYIDMSHQSVLLIPFEPYMYQSDINRELHEENNMSGKEIKERFIAAIDQSFQYTFGKRCEVKSFYYLEENERAKDLSFVFNNRKLEYVTMSSSKETSEKVGLAALKNVFSKQKPKAQKNGRIENGEIVTEIDKKNKYMKAVAEDILIDSLDRKFNADFILFVNELDIKNIYGSVYDMSSLNYNRQIKLHYTLYRSNGEILSTGISATKFPATENNIDNIIQNHFPVLAQNIYNDLFKEATN